MLTWIKEKIWGITTKEAEQCKFDMLKSIGNTTEKRFEREAKANEIIAEKYDLETLTKDQYHALKRQLTDMLYQKEQEDDLRKKTLLRRIKTLRTKKEIKKAIKAGHLVLQQKVIPSKEIYVKDYYMKDKKTGEVRIELSDRNIRKEDYDHYTIIERNYYPYTFPSKTAAYLLPDDLEIGERVILEDLIEDIVGESHAWGNYRLDSAEAVWNGKMFDVDCKSYDVQITFG